MARAKRARWHDLTLRAASVTAAAATLLATAASAQVPLSATPADVHAPASLTASLNLAWVLVGGFLVMFMQVGLRDARDRVHARRRTRSTRWR